MYSFQNENTSKVSVINIHNSTSIRRPFDWDSTVVGRRIGVEQRQIKSSQIVIVTKNQA